MVLTLYQALIQEFKAFCWLYTGKYLPPSVAWQLLSNQQECKCAASEAHALLLLNHVLCMSQSLLKNVVVTPNLLWKVEHGMTSSWCVCECWGRGMMNVFSSETTKHLDIQQILPFPEKSQMLEFRHFESRVISVGTLHTH